MRRFVAVGTAFLSIVATAGAASAADLGAISHTEAPAQIATAYDWSGFYIGANGGGGWSRKCWDVLPNTSLFIIIAAPVSEGCHMATGAVVGGQLGYRWQTGAWVFGVEGQGDWANLSGSNVSNLFPGAGGASNRSKIDAVGLVTGQVGYAWNNILFYVKGGAIAVSDKYEGVRTAAGSVFDTSSETRWGGAVGAGLDFGVTPNIIIGVDYVHGFMGSRDNSFLFAAAGTASRGDRIRQDIDLVTARISYKFGGPVVAKY